MSGQVDIKKLARSMTAKQFVGWELYMRMEPFDQMRDDYRAASIVMMIHNMAVDPKYRKDIDHFLLKYKETERPVVRKADPDAMPQWQMHKQAATMFALSYNAEIKARQKLREL